MTCVLNREIDFFITEHARVKALRQDTTLLIQKVRTFKSIINDQDDVLKARNKQIELQQRVITQYKNDYSGLQIKYAACGTKAIRRKKIIFILIGTTILFGAIAILK